MALNSPFVQLFNIYIRTRRMTTLAIENVTRRYVCTWDRQRALEARRHPSDAHPITIELIAGEKKNGQTLRGKTSAWRTPSAIIFIYGGRYAAMEGIGLGLYRGCGVRRGTIEYVRRALTVQRHFASCARAWDIGDDPLVFSFGCRRT